MQWQIAKKYEAFTIGTIGTPAKKAFLEEQGYDRIIVRSKKFPRDLDSSLEGRELNLILDCIGGKIFKQGYEQLAPMGRVIVYGSAHYAFQSDSPNYLRLLSKYLVRPKLDPQKMIEQNKAVMGFNLIWLYEKAGLLEQILQHLETMDLAKPYVGHLFGFDQLPEALRFFQSGVTMGKVVVWSATLQRDAITDRAPAYWKARVRPMRPSPPSSWPITRESFPSGARPCAGPEDR